MRIAFFAPRDCEQKKNWARALHSLGHTIYWLSFDSDIHQLPVKTYFQLPPFKWYPYLQFILRSGYVKRILRREKIDWVHAFYTTNYGLLAALSCNGKFSVTAAGSDILIEPTRKPLLKRINQFSLAKSSLIHSASVEITETLKSNYKHLAKIVTMPEGVDTNIFAPGHKPDSNKIIITTTRKFTPIYNQTLQAEAAVILARKHVPFEYHFIGDGPEKDACMQIVKQGGAADHCVFHGALAQSKLADILNRSHIYVSTSLSDGTSTALLEAMAAGAFPVVSDIPANRAWIKPGRNGYLVPVNDANQLAHSLLKAIQESELRKKSADINRKTVLEKAELRKIVLTFLHEIQPLIKNAKTSSSTAQ